ncbi:FAD-linked oxidoreductase-like protein [Podospora aff. communis PSN243]|uniref:Proline dehydrogenase n=1 Tax=Podospora aff. communis PSN243 TaxID=3040156 RepID=A0AAV9G7M2_9PEZI|nr:FAD-linked oxidoreductase-like protein [Podospora aff. communis PSN243]
MEGHCIASQEELAEAYRNSRLSLPAALRIPLATGMSFILGWSLGTAQGSKMAGLRFRAEHAHKLPDTTTGWYMYHRSKNYHVATAGLIEGVKMGLRVSFWTTTMLGIEHMFDTYRGTADVLNTLTSCVTVAGGFSLWNRFSLPMAARTTKTAVVVGLLYGGVQDVFGAMRGRPIGYIDFTPSSTDSLTINEASSLLRDTPPEPAPEDMAKRAPLAVLPLTSVLRTLMTTTVSSSKFLLPPSLAIMSVLANSHSPALNPDRNPLLRFILKKTFYTQFCAGENAAEVRHTIASLKKIGFSGVILGYAKEVVLTDAQTRDLTSNGIHSAAAQECITTEIKAWADGTMATVSLASPGDFVALKFTGAGRQALYALSQRLPPSEALASAIDHTCQLAASRGVRLLFDAEQQAVQAGIDDWTLEYMRRFNTPEKAIVYGTYQAYLKATPQTLTKHLLAARDGNFTLGVKLVRGAYLGSDPRHLIHDTKSDTDACYDGIAEALLRKEWMAPLQLPTNANTRGFPNVNMVLASHNRDSVLKARSLIDGGNNKTEVAFAQLQGMADEVSCELVAGREQDGRGEKKLNAYKYLVWGSTGECMKYLLRRAQENRDAVQRTRSGRDAMRAEVVRRVKGFFGFA